VLLLALWLVAATGTPLAAKEAAELPDVASGACVCCGPGVAPAQELVASEEWLQLRDGGLLKRTERVERGSSLQGSAAAAVLLPHPPEQVWEVLTDFESWPRFMPHLTSTQITRREGRHEWVEQRFRILLSPMRHTTVYELDALNGRLSWELDLEQAHDIASSRGMWQLAPADEGRSTLLRYASSVDSGREVPGFIERMLVERSLDDLFASLRSELGRRYARAGE
jgi:ribosome-associated toxin RatA of RatAB toxin-antitoxin module